MPKIKKEIKSEEAVKPVTPNTPPKAKKPDGVEWTNPKPKKKRMGKTVLGGKQNEIVLHPRVKRITSFGKIVESRTAVIAYGRANPPTIGHERLVTEAANIAEEIGGHAMMFMSPTNNSKNPLTDTQKLFYVNEAFGRIVDVREEMFSNPITLLQALAESYDHLVWVTGDDQFKDYNRITETYNGKDFDFKSTRVVSLVRDGDQINETISATQMREAASSGNREAFAAGLPTHLREHVDNLFEEVSAGIAIHENVDNPLINKVRDKIVQTLQG